MRRDLCYEDLPRWSFLRLTRSGSKDYNLPKGRKPVTESHIVVSSTKTSPVLTSFF